MPHFPLHDGSANFGAAVRAFISEVDLRHAPVRLDVAQIHSQSDAARTKDEGRFDIVVMMDIGWHVGSPQEDIQESIHQWSLTRRKTYASAAKTIMNSREHRQNVPKILACVAYLHDLGTAPTTRQFASRDGDLPSARGGSDAMRPLINALFSNSGNSPLVSMTNFACCVYSTLFSAPVA